MSKKPTSNSKSQTVSTNASMPLRGRCTFTPIGAQKAFLDINSKNASIALTGRCTSTPIGPDRLSFSRLGASNALDISCGSCSTISMDDSAVPIFGRRKLQLLSENERKKDEPGVCKALSEQKIHQRALANAEKTFDEIGKSAETSSSACRQMKTGAKRKVVQGKKRRSTHNDSRAPIFKVTPKVPKSPRLLTAIRAKLKANRAKAKNDAEMMELERQKAAKKQGLCENPKRPAPKVSPSLFNKFKITIPMSPKITKTKKYMYTGKNIVL